MFFIFQWKWLPFLFLYEPILHRCQLGDYFPNQVARSKILGATATKMVATWRSAFDYLRCTVFFHNYLLHPSPQGWQTSCMYTFFKPFFRYKEIESCKISIYFGTVWSVKQVTDRKLTNRMAKTDLPKSLMITHI